MFVDSSQTVSSNYYDDTLNNNLSYTYAFYNGTINGTSLVLTNNNNVAQYATAITSNLYNPILTAPTILTNSAIISYNLNNKLSAQTGSAYLYRFNGNNAPNVLDTTGTHLINYDVSQNYEYITSYTDNTVVIDNIYTYAFYNGNVNNNSQILLDNSINLLPKSLTIQTFYDIVGDLNATNILNTSAQINYNIYNVLTSGNTVYLYRFNEQIIHRVH